MKKTSFTILVYLVLFPSYIIAQKTAGIAKTPPMGWNSWNTFGTNISEKLIKDVADIFVSKGFQEAGYNYIVLDDGWMAKERDAQGNLVADPEKFPNGIKALSDYIHSKGLKIGIYNCAGDKTCGGYPGSRGHEYQDALMYASWGIDFLKYDWCNTAKINAESAYTTMRDALYKTGRPIVFSICEWGDNQPWLWGKDTGHLWRISGDITNCWDCQLNHGTWSSWGIMKIVDMHSKERLRQYSGPDAWNDLDMMEVGNGMRLEEDKSHFALWCMHASPLIMGHDLRTSKKETTALLTNKDVIAINQDPLGIEGFRFFSENNLEIWAKPLKDDNWAVMFLNRGTESIKVKFDWKKEERIEDNMKKLEANFIQKKYAIQDLFQNISLDNTDKTLEKELKGHDVLLLKLTKL